eukprot:CAMPEP_0113623360 /NCGR_PEP_ID=MMETSP0017_2-20120614/12012_1 /TAXON_ID=2856 /ORGANISM="Cylindrotheca closterium" /LENGTH=331 /DNA_ID=CAMNT_0000533297 /DNA_START=236 /DNA_END=1231 /DNA_ORIENTATION=+ /assembly_acc=CAM_ASM_000147
MELTRQNRAGYAKRYAVMHLLKAFRAVSEMKTMDATTLASRLHETFVQSVLANEHDLEESFLHEVINEYYKTWDSLTPDANGKSIKENKNAWKRVGKWRRHIKIWNASAPKLTDVPSGITNSKEWRHEELTKILWCKQTPKKDEVFDRTTWHAAWQPGIEWPAYEYLDLMDDIKFSAGDPTVVRPDDPTAPTARRQSVSRAQQKNIERGTAKHNSKKKKTKKRHHAEAAHSPEAYADRLKIATLKSVHDGLIKRLKYCKSEAKTNEIEGKLEYISGKMIALVSGGEESNEESTGAPVHTSNSGSPASPVTLEISMTDPDEDGSSTTGSDSE